MAETVAEIARLLKLGPEAPLQPPRFAKVVSVSGDTVTVTLGGSNVDAVRCCACSTDDVVLLETMPSGQLAAVATKGASGGGPAELSADDLTLPGLLHFSPDNFTATQGGTLVPYLYNDISHLSRRSGTVAATLDGNAITLADADYLFDGSPRYAYYNTTGATSLVLEITLPTDFTRNYANTVYIVFGPPTTRATGVKIESHNSGQADGVWTERYNVSGSAEVYHYVKFSESSNNLTKLRFTLTGLPSGPCRILEIGTVNYNSPGTHFPYMSRGGDDAVYRSLTPNTDNAYTLGTSSKRWSEGRFVRVYADQVRANTSYYGTCSTAAGTAAKTVSCSGFVLVRGAVVCVSASTANTVSSDMTLNVNSTGAKTVRRKDSTSGMPQWVANSMLIFCYDGTYWRFCGGDWQ